ncbi:DUF6332 family protein [Streptomyces sp. NPDC051569]|uniref:DUF6332 family protein n=1 Tax=Streptomyces sp. NPDC051569 TaxID=3365661 RepID=UPI0037A4FDB8
MGTRSSAERDAMTVETGFALMTGTLAAGLVFAVLAGSAWYFDLPEAFPRVAAVAAGAVFVARVVRVLRRFRGQFGQPSRPGRTDPDS